MRWDELKERVQPALERDFDTVRDEFGGDKSPQDFVQHLRQTGQIPATLADTLSAPVPEGEGEEAHTVVMGEDMLAQVEALGQAYSSADPEEAESADGQPSGLASNDPATTFTPPAAGLGSGGWLDPRGVTPEAPRRTMFRRRTDGALRETGVQEIEARPRSGRRRIRPPETSSDRYQFIGMVGEGAMGRVHLAEDHTLHRKVAYKAMSEEIAEQSTLAGKFTAEAQITAQLDHPNIVPVYSLESSTAYTMKHIKGRTLEAIIAEAKARGGAGKPLVDQLSLQGRLELFLRACDAMFYAHSRGVVHRDLKPENIMVGEFGELYVMDWGIAKLMPGEFPDKVTVKGEIIDEGDLVIGTPGYMSPEQAEGENDTLDGRSDQYALGLILFELLCLKPAVTGKAPLKLVMRHQDGEKDPLVHIHGEKLPTELVAIVHKATAQDPEHRYENVKAFAEDIRRYLRGEEVQAKPDSTRQALLRWIGHHRELTLAVMFLLFMGSGAIIMGTFGLSQLALSNQKNREHQLTNLLTTVARQSSLIDGQFLRYEGLLSVIASTAIDKLQHPSFDEDPYYTLEDYADPERQPEGIIESSRYGIPIHLVEGVFALAEGTSVQSVMPDVYRLEDMEKHFYRVLLRSRSEAAVGYAPNLAARAIAEVGVPLAWTYIGLENGVYTAFPGHGSFPARFDHRTTPWYALAKDRRGPTWGAPSIDVSGRMLVLTCAQSLYDDEEQFRGVAGIDVTFDSIIGELLEAPEFKGNEHVEAFLLDPEGRIAVRSSRKNREFQGAIRGRTLRMPDFHHPQVVQGVKEGRSGHIQVRGEEGTELVVYNRMNSIGWYYVVAGKVEHML